MVILITGASGGFGRVLGKTLVEGGMAVYGTMRDPAAGADLPFPALAMEVTDPESVAACVNEIVEREGRIDAVVNCVNQMIIGSVEEQTVDEVRALYDTNVFGVLQVCQQVIPVMRRQGSGTIVNMSSLGGLLAVPYMSAYTSAKFALEALSESMYHELKPDGISVVIMQPVAMAMDRPATGAHLATVEGAKPDSFSQQMVAQMARDTAASKLRPETVASEIHRVLLRKKKPLRVPMDRAKAISLVKRIAPQAMIDRLIDGFLKAARSG